MINDAEYNEASHKLYALLPGERYVYFKGHLSFTRETNPHGTVAAISYLAYRLWQDGRVLLTQRRMGDPIKTAGYIDWKQGVGMGFEYIATGATPPKQRMKIPGRSIYNPLVKVLK
jgi:hypothetical protein